MKQVVLVTGASSGIGAATCRAFIASGHRPHNFGINQTENLQNLQDIVEHYKTLQTKYGMQSANMREITKYASESNG